MTMMMDSTDAKIGRSIKNGNSWHALRGLFLMIALGSLAFFLLVGNRIYLNAWMDSVNSFHDNLFSCLQAAFNQPFIALPCAGLYRAEFSFSFIDDIDERAAWLLLHGALGNQNCSCSAVPLIRTLTNWPG